MSTAMILLFAVPASPRGRVVRPSVVESGHILFIAAHPDDEIVVAPLLAALCVEGFSTCSFLVLTRGEAGTCATAPCTPDLGTVREREMQAAASIFRAALTQWDLPDVVADFDTAWEGAADRIAAHIAAQRPDIIITFDPLHGTTCHPAHRELGSIVIGAAGDIPLYLLATAARLEEDAYRFSAGSTMAMSFAASRWWRYAVDAASAHASQFTAEQLDALRATPHPEQQVWLTRPSASRVSAVTCP